MAFSSSKPPFQKKPFRGKRPVNEEHRLNERIRVPKVRLIDHEGKQVGIVETSKALQMARDVGLDLMEVAPNSRPPVCKIIDYGKFKYEKKKKEHAAKKKQTVIKVKEVQLRPNTEAHDLDYKYRNIRAFLEDGDKAKITMLFRGREITHPELGFKIMDELAEAMQDVGLPEAKAKMEGRKLIMILAPVKKKSEVKAEKEKEKKKKVKQASGTEKNASSS